MAATVVYVTEREWKVLVPFLRRCGEGAILIPPDVRKYLEERADGKELPTWIEYDFGGDPDVWLDVVWDEKTDHCAIDLICGATEDGSQETPIEDEDL